MNTSRKWQEMKKVYLCFTQKDVDLDYSQQAEQEMYKHESIGSEISATNGYYWCKRNMDITLAMWEEELKAGNLTKYELIEAEEQFPTEWLQNWLSSIYIPRKTTKVN